MCTVPDGHRASGTQSPLGMVPVGPSVQTCMLGQQQCLKMLPSRVLQGWGCAAQSHSTDGQSEAQMLRAPRIRVCCRNATLPKHTAMMQQLLQQDNWANWEMRWGRARALWSVVTVPHIMCWGPTTRDSFCSQCLTHEHLLPAQQTQSQHHSSVPGHGIAPMESWQGKEEVQPQMFSFLFKDLKTGASKGMC